MVRLHPGYRTVQVDKHRSASNGPVNDSTLKCVLNADFQNKAGGIRAIARTDLNDVHVVTICVSGRFKIRRPAKDRAPSSSAKAASSAPPETDSVTESPSASEASMVVTDAVPSVTDSAPGSVMAGAVLVGAGSSGVSSGSSFLLQPETNLLREAVIGISIDYGYRSYGCAPFRATKAITLGCLSLGS